MKKPDSIRLIALILVLAVATFYPVTKILNFEYPKTPPQEFRFRCDAVDPYDPFRGRYVTVRPLPNSILAQPGEKYERGKYRYAVLATDKDGLATVTRLTDKIPENEPFVSVNYTYTSSRYEQGKRSKEEYHNFRLPFDRYYLNEKLAPEAEKLVQEMTRKDKKDCVLSVLIYADGTYAVKDLLIQGKPIRDVLRK